MFGSDHQQDICNAVIIPQGPLRFSWWIYFVSFRGRFLGLCVLWRFYTHTLDGREPLLNTPLSVSDSGSVYYPIAMHSLMQSDTLFLDVSWCARKKSDTSGLITSDEHRVQRKCRRWFMWMEIKSWTKTGNYPRTSHRYNPIWIGLVSLTK